jgi:hypothetical protein
MRAKNLNAAYIPLVVPKEYAGHMPVFDDIVPDSDIPSHAISVLSRFVEILIVSPHVNNLARSVRC